MKCSHVPENQQRRRPAFASNPFATRLVSPGRLPWLAEPENSLAALAERLKSTSRPLGAIVGPHGSGKSTLLAHLVLQLGGTCWHQADPGAPPIAAPQGNSVWLVLRRRQQPLQQILRSRCAWSGGRILILDGLEQLRSSQYFYVRLLLRSHCMGLVATCHRACRTLPTIADTTANVPTVQRLIYERLKGHPVLSAQFKNRSCQAQFVQQLLAEEQGSVREVFMRLYDLVENQISPRQWSMANLAAGTKIKSSDKFGGSWIG